ncbi:hypothetical protein Cgig2_002065 [Carnegiea gigantea]|uniref:Uncharacterized protein n=1 Tax=Carnegiea gigantea TaxID=171969 RepID=A0A9Q1JNP4_9CARY|nr:hypothetical protein Cgig2_002065 [Carnegiea gigantea]
MSSTYGGTNLDDVRHRPVPMVVQTWALCDDVQYLWWYELGWASPQLGVEAAGYVVGCQLANHPSWVVTPPRDTPLGGAPWQGTCPAGTYLLAAVGGLAEETCPLGMAVVRWQLAKVVTWRLVCQKTHSFIVTPQGKQAHHKEKLGSGARIYDQRCCTITPSIYGGARHANKPERYATTSSTYGSRNLGIVRRCPIPMVFMVDSSVELWELPTKMTELGSSGSYLSWASPQLGVEAAGRGGSWTCRGLQAGQPPELGGYAPKGHASWRRPLARRLPSRCIPLGSRGRAG